MTEIDAIAKLKEMFSQDYQISADGTVEIVNYCDQLSESISSLENPDLDFYLNILQNLRLFFNSEFLFLSKQTNKALSNYQKLRDSFSKTQTEFPDYYSSWQYDIDRLMLRIDARTQNLRAYAILDEQDFAQAEILKLLLLHILDEKIEFATISNINNNKSSAETKHIPNEIENNIINDSSIIHFKENYGETQYEEISNNNVPFKTNKSSKYKIGLA